MWLVYRPMYSTILGLNLYEWSFILMIVGSLLFMVGLANVLFGEYSDVHTIRP